MYSSFPSTLESFFPTFRSSTCSSFNKRFATKCLHHDHFLSGVDPRVAKRMTTMQIMTSGCCNNDLNGWHRVGLAKRFRLQLFQLNIGLCKKKNGQGQKHCKNEKRKRKKNAEYRKKERTAAGQLCRPPVTYHHIRFSSSRPCRKHLLLRDTLVLNIRHETTEWQMFIVHQRWHCALGQELLSQHFSQLWTPAISPYIVHFQNQNIFI